MDLTRRFYATVITIFILAVLSAIYLSRMFLMTVVLSAFLAYILYPLYAYILKITGHRSASSILSLTVVFLVLISMSLILILMLINETSRLIESGGEMVSHVEYISDSLTDFIHRYLPSPAADNIGHIPTRALDWILLILSGWLATFVADLPLVFTHFVLLIFFTYYALVDGKRIINRVVNILPQKVIVREFISELDDIYNSLFHVFLITSALTGSLAAIGFFLLGLPYPLLLGLLVAFLELIPLLGSSTVVLPMAFYYALVRDYAMAAALLILGTLFLSVIPENVVRPRLAHRGARIHPVITILAFATPLFVVGLPGVILGPAVYGLALAGYRTLTYLEKL